MCMCGLCVSCGLFNIQVVEFMKKFAEEPFETFPRVRTQCAVD